MVRRHRRRLVVAAGVAAIHIDLHLHSLNSGVDEELGYDPHAHNRTGIPLSMRFRREDVDYCEATNIVLDRNGSGSPDWSDYARQGVMRPYSITGLTFGGLHNRCQNLDTALVAIRNGTRAWVDATVGERPPDRERNVSYFVPHDCDLPLLTAERACAVLGRYARVVVNGDSLSRHMVQALKMLLNSDLVTGGLGKVKRPVSHGRDPYIHCKCDGQFSEVGVCRQFEFDGMSLRDPGVEEQACPGAKLRLDCVGMFHHNKMRKKDIAHIEKTLFDILRECDDPAYRGAAWVLQGSAHFEVDARLAMSEWINVILDHPAVQHCGGDKLRFIWLSQGSQSRRLDAKYPHQSRENALRFNLEMEEILRRRVPNITIIDWWRLTQEAQTSDGFHFLSDVNLVKANHLLSALDYMTLGRA